MAIPVYMPLTNIMDYYCLLSPCAYIKTFSVLQRFYVCWPIMLVLVSSLHHFLYIILVCTSVLVMFKVEYYEGEFIKIGKYLSFLTREESWSKEDFYRIMKKAYKFFLIGHLGRIKIGRMELCFEWQARNKIKKILIAKFHDSVWAAHLGIWATFAKRRESQKYWWPIG